MCLNCLSNTHQISSCKSKVSCKIKGCRKRHNTILHNFSYKPPSSNADSTAVSKNRQQQSVNKISKISIVIQEPLQNIYFCNFFSVTLKNSTRPLQSMPYSTVDQTPPSYLETLHSILVFKVK